MSSVHPPSNASASNSDASTFAEGIGFPSGFVRTEAMRMLQREQEKAVAVLETSPLLSYLFFTYVISAKAAPDSPVSDQSEELSALKLRSEKLESESIAAQVALAEAHTMVESLREEIQKVKVDMAEDRLRHAAVLEEREGENGDLRRQAQKYKSEGEALQKITANQQLEMVRAKQQSTAEKAVLQTRLDELQRRFNDLSRRQEEGATPTIGPLTESTTSRTPQSPESPSTPLWRPEYTPQRPSWREQQVFSPDARPSEPSTSQVPALPGDAQTSDPPSTLLLSKSQKLRAKRAAKKLALQAAEEEAASLAARTEVLTEAS